MAPNPNYREVMRCRAQSVMVAARSACRSATADECLRGASAGCHRAVPGYPRLCLRQRQEHQQTAQPRRAGEAKERNADAKMLDGEARKGRAERGAGGHRKSHKAHRKVEPAAAVRDVRDDQRHHHPNRRRADAVKDL